MQTNAQANAALEPALMERRVHARVPVKLKVGFQLLSDDAALEEVAQFDSFAQQSGQAQTLDVSVGGLKILGSLSLMGSRRLEKGSYLKVEIEVPGRAQGIQTVSSVAWSRKTSEQGQFEAGLCFIGLDPSDAHMLEEFLKSKGAE